MLQLQGDGEQRDPCLDDVSTGKGFSSFLEALVDEDDLHACSDAVPSRSTDHKPSQASPNITSHCNRQLVLEDKSPAEARESAIQCSVPAACSARPTTRETQLEKRRAKNRRTQQAFRKRQRERRESLQTQVDATAQKLEETRHRWRQLRLHRSSLRQRVTGALQVTPSHSHSSPTPSHSQDHPVDVAQTSNPGDSQLQAVHNLQGLDSQLVPKITRASFCEISGHQKGYVPNEEYKGIPRPISSFARCEALSFAAVSPFMAPSEAPRQTYKYNAITQAVVAYQQTVSARTGVSVDRICWFLQWRFPGVEPNLSFTATGSSPECSLCASLSLLMGSLESMFLVVEHEMLQEASDPSFVPPHHPSLVVSATPVTPPTHPDPKLLSRCYIRCGVNQTLLVKEGLDRAFKPLLARFRASLPRDRWRAVCMQAMRMLQAIVDALSDSAGSSKGSPADIDVSSEGHDDVDVADRGKRVGNATTRSSRSPSIVTTTSAAESMAWEDFGLAVVATNQYVLCCIHDALQESTSSESGGSQLIAVSLAAVEQRMFEIVCTSHMTTASFLQTAPIIARRMIVTQFLSQSQNIVRASRQIVKLYKQLQLQPDQRACMAERWRSWCRRRAAFGHQLLNAVARFEEACPQQSDLPSALVHMDYLVATTEQPEAPVAKTNQDILQHPLPTAAMHAPSVDADGAVIEYASESCIGSCARALHGVHPMLPTHQKHNSSMAQDLEEELCDLTEDSARMHAVHASMHAECVQVSQEWGSGGPQMHEQSSVTCVWARCFSRFNPDMDSDTVRNQGACANCDSVDLGRLEIPTEGEASIVLPEDSYVHADINSKSCVQGLRTSGVIAQITSMHDVYASTAASATNASEACIVCDPHMRRSRGADASCSGMDGMYNTWAPCMVCGEGRRALLLGESGQVAKAAYDALGSVLDVHTSDALMHFEFVGPFWELTEKQQAVLLAAAIDLGQPKADMVALWQAVAEEERREALFGHLSALYI